MPQMAPMNWLSFYIFFSLIFMMLNFQKFLHMYFNPNSQSTDKKCIKKAFNWKW